MSPFFGPQEEAPSQGSLPYQSKKGRLCQAVLFCQCESAGCLGTEEEFEVERRMRAGRRTSIDGASGFRSLWCRARQSQHAFVVPASLYRLGCRGAPALERIGGAGHRAHGVDLASEEDLTALHRLGD